MSISADIKREAILWMKGYYCVQLWNVDSLPIAEDGKAVLRGYNEEMIAQYEAELLAHDLKVEINLPTYSK